MPDRAARRDRLAGQRRAAGDPHLHPGALPCQADGRTDPGSSRTSDPDHQTPHRRRLRRQAGDADRRHRRPPRARNWETGAPHAEPLRGVRLQPHPAPPDDHVQDGGQQRRRVGQPVDAHRGKHRCVRDARAHGANGEWPPWPELVQLPQQEVRLRRCVHQPSCARRLPRLRSAPGLVCSRVPHGRRCRRHRHGRSRVQEPQLDQGRRSRSMLPPSWAKAPTTWR